MAKSKGSALGSGVRASIDLAKTQRARPKASPKRRTLSVASEIGDMVADAAYHLRRPLVDLAEELLREGVRRLAAEEAERTQSPDFEFARRPKKGRRWA